VLSELKKYYWSRFDSHAESIKFAQKTRAAAEERMAQLQAIKGTGLLDVQFLVDASDTVIRNKRILQWLYVYGFFFDAPEGSSDRALFELHQATVRTRASDLVPAKRAHGSHRVAFTHLAHRLFSFPALLCPSAAGKIHRRAARTDGAEHGGVDEARDARSNAVLLSDRRKVPRPSHRR